MTLLYMTKGQYERLKERGLSTPNLLDEQAPDAFPGLTLRHELLKGAVQFDTHAVLSTNLFSRQFLNEQCPGKPPGYTNLQYLFVLSTDYRSNDICTLFLTHQFLTQPFPGEREGYINFHYLLERIVQYGRNAFFSLNMLKSPAFLNRPASLLQEGYTARHFLLQTAAKYKSNDFFSTTDLFSDEFLDEQRPGEINGYTNRQYLFVLAIRFKNNALFSSEGLFFTEFFDSQYPGESPGKTNFHYLLHRSVQNKNDLIFSRSLLVTSFLDRPCRGPYDGYTNRHVLLDVTVRYKNNNLFSNKDLFSAAFLEQPHRALNTNYTNRHHLLRTAVHYANNELLFNNSLFTSEFLDSPYSEESDKYTVRHHLLCMLFTSRNYTPIDEGLFSEQFLKSNVLTQKSFIPLNERCHYIFREGADKTQIRHSIAPMFFPRDDLTIDTLKKIYAFFESEYEEKFKEIEREIQCLSDEIERVKIWLATSKVITRTHFPSFYSQLSVENCITYEQDPGWESITLNNDHGYYPRENLEQLIETFGYLFSSLSNCVAFPWDIRPGWSMNELKNQLRSLVQNFLAAKYFLGSCGTTSSSYTVECDNLTPEEEMEIQTTRFKRRGTFFYKPLMNAEQDPAICPTPGRTL